MGDIVKQTVIDAPVKKVYDYIVDPHNAPNYISAITRIISGPEGKPTKGDVWLADANFLGQKHTLNLRLDAMAVDKGVRFVLEGDPQAVLDLRVAPVENRSDQTSVRMSLDVPSVPGLLLNAMLGGMLGEDMARLKRNLEK